MRRVVSLALLWVENYPWWQSVAGKSLLSLGLERSLKILEKAVGPDHPDVAASLNNLTSLYCNQKQYAKAEPLYQRALQIWEKALGPDHPDVASALEGYADLLNKMGRNKEAATSHARGDAIQNKHNRSMISASSRQ